MISKSRLKQIQALHSKKNRDDERLFIAEGPKVVKEIVLSRSENIEELFATRDFIDKNRLLLSNSEIKISEISERELEQISAQSAPSGALAVCRFFEDTLPSPDFEKECALYLDEIRDPGNFGTIVRAADWFGIQTVFCSQNSCDFYNPKVIQSTMGAFLRVKIVYADLAAVISEHKVKNVYGAVLSGKDLYAEKLENGLIVIGNEASGISEKNLGLVNHALTIPSHASGGSESLNAAMATAVILSEFFRQLR